MKLRRSAKQIQRLSPRFRMILFGSGVFIAALTVAFLYSNLGTSEKAHAGTEIRSSLIITQPNTMLNECEPLTADASAGATQIRVLNNSVNYYNRFEGSLDSGSLILIVQMQENASPTNRREKTETMSSETGAGKYEFAEVASIEMGSRINLTAPLKYSYSVSGKTQIVRVPRLANLTINPSASITADAWDGTTGGIVALETEGKLLIHGSINASGKGLQGGIPEQKTRTPSRHGFSIDTEPESKEGADRIFAGTGGSKGINGGGIVFLLADGTIEGSGRIECNGGSASGLRTKQTGKLAGGSGGTIFIYTPNTPVNGITLQANGGNGSIPENSTAPEATFGRGGRGGIIRTTMGGTAVCQTENGSNRGSGNAGSIDKADASTHGAVTSGPIFPYSYMGGTGTVLKYFSATASSQGVSISWVTASEWNNDFFTVERSIDGQAYTSVVKISGKGNPDGETNYHYNDENLVSGHAYYRLALTDLDEHTHTFPPIEVRMEKKGEPRSALTVNPNPFTDHLTANCQADEAGLVDLRLMDLSGKIYRNETAIVKTGINAILLDNLENIPAGVYLLSLTNSSGRTINQKVMK